MPCGFQGIFIYMFKMLKKGDFVHYFSDDGVTRKFVCISDETAGKFAELRCSHCQDTEVDWFNDPSSDFILYNHTGPDSHTFHICKVTNK